MKRENEGTGEKITKVKEGGKRRKGGEVKPK